MAINVSVDILNFKKILYLIKFYKIDLVLVGPEEPLVKGLVDFLRTIKLLFLDQTNLLKLEGSKAFMKRSVHNIRSLRLNTKSTKKVKLLVF